METLFNSPEFLPELLSGKYSRWAERLDADTLHATLLAVGEFARRYSPMHRPDGSFPAPIFHENVIGAEFRMVYALEALATIYAYGKPACLLRPVGGFSLSLTDPAFSHEFSERLARNSLTVWAQGLDENSVALLLWNIGEYCCRIRRCPPAFEGPPKEIRRMRAALRYLNSIYRKVSRA